MGKPIQYLVVGFPYSGKTTLAKELERRLGWARINVDEFKFNRGYTEVRDDDVPDNVWEEIFGEIDDLIVKYLKEGKNIVNEYAWITREWRSRARRVAKDAGFETRLIYIKVPKEIVRDRWQENIKTKSRFNMPEAEFLRSFGEFEEPTADEDTIIYDQTIHLDRWIEQNLV